VIVNFLLAGHFLHALGPALPASSPLSSTPLGLVLGGELSGGAVGDVGGPSDSDPGGAVAVGGAVVRPGGAAIAITGVDVTPTANIESAHTIVRRNSARYSGVKIVSRVFI
jgi:hypothetical protein